MFGHHAETRFVCNPRTIKIYAELGLQFLVVGSSQGEVFADEWLKGVSHLIVCLSRLHGVIPKVCLGIGLGRDGG